MLKLIFALLLPMSVFSQIPPIESGVSQTLAKWRAAHYSDVRYKLDLLLEKQAPLMKGNIEIRVTLDDVGASNPLVLDWRTTQFQNDKDTPYANVIGVNDATDIVSQENNEHILIPNGLLKKGENVIKITFASPLKTSGSAITRYIDKEDGSEYIYSLFVPSDASTAFPVFDQPDLKARFTLNVLAPHDWKVISNSATEEFSVKALVNNPRSYEDKQEIDQNRRWVRFLETKPISTYVFAYAAGEFAEVSEPTADGSDLLTKIYVRKSQSEKFKQHSAKVFRLNREGVKFLEEYFDYKFPFPKYDLVLIPEFPFGGMEHAGATFLRESSVIFPTEPTKNDHVSRANLIFHEAAHQWFGDTVTMKWFDDLWLKEGFAEFMAYKTLEKVMPEYNAWKIFYERNKQAAYLTDSTKGTTPIYQEIQNLSSAKSAYGNIVYRKAPSFLKQAEFYFASNKFQTAVRAFLKKHEFANAKWQDLVNEFEGVVCFGNRSMTYSEDANGQRIREMQCLDKSKKKPDLSKWADSWVKKRGVPIIRVKYLGAKVSDLFIRLPSEEVYQKEFKVLQGNSVEENSLLEQEFDVRLKYKKGSSSLGVSVKSNEKTAILRVSELAAIDATSHNNTDSPVFIFPNYQDYGYGIFLLDGKSRAYVLENIQNEKDDFLRSMMWGSLWDSVRFYELAPEDYVELVIKNLNVETDESTIQTLLGRTSTALNSYIQNGDTTDKLRIQLENLLIDKIKTAPTVGQKITFYRAFLNIAASENARVFLKMLLNGNAVIPDGTDVGKMPVFRTKDKFDIVTRLVILDDADALKLLENLEKTETSDDAKRYAYAARAGIPTPENKAKYWNDFVNNKEISESWIEAAFAVFNTPRHAELTTPYLEKALAELPNLKKNRKIFFVNGWLGSFIGGQRSQESLDVTNKFLAANPNLDKDLRLKILENADGIERAVKIRNKYR